MEKIIQYCPERKMVSSQELIEEGFDHSLKEFDELTISFFNKLSRALLSDKIYNRHPEIVALGFWLRESSINSMKDENFSWLNSSLFSINPIGLVFHVAPSNVDTIFLYSTCISLLMGNRNIVRISSTRQSQVILFIIDSINKVLNETKYMLLKKYLKIITYSHDETINQFLSSSANCRIIWGGDSTILHFKNIQGALSTKDILFPNRISYSLFGAKEYLRKEKKEQLTVTYNFFNDAYTFDQLGCSSPRIIYVLGNVQEKEEFIKVFYNFLSEIAEKRYYEQASLLSVQKFNHLINDVISNCVVNVVNRDNAVYLVEIKNKFVHTDECAGGYFYVIYIENVEEIGSNVPQIAQTLTYFGISNRELLKLNQSLFGKRIDRIVPVGEALSFHYIWDGMNLFEELSRKRYIKGTI